MLNLNNTLDGYLKNVEVIGNTIQDTNNLANIRSVGDKVEGQELYNISIQVGNGDGVSEVVEILSPVQLEKVGDVTDRIIYKDGVWGIDKKVDAEVKNNVLVNTRTNSEFIPLPHDQQVKLRTFAGQTNIAFLTEIPGQVKAQVPKSLGATVNTHTEQIAELHNSLDRVKKLEETTISTIETGSSFTTVDATSNGYFEDVKLEGKTLVNLWDKDIIDLSTSAHNSPNYSHNLKANTVYTFIFNATVANYDIVYLYAYTSNNVLKYYNLTATTSGLNIKTFIPSEDVRISYIGRSSTIEGLIYSNCMLLEGDHTNNLPEFFEGLMSVGQDVEEISVESEYGNGNLFDENVLNKYITSSGEDSFTLNYPAMYIDNFMYPIKSKGQHIFRYTCKETVGNKNPTFYFIYKDGTKDYINTETTSEFVTYEKTSNINKELVGIKFIYYGNGGNWVIKKNSIMLSKCTESKPYVPYKSDKKTLLYYNTENQTWEKPILREWDTIEKHSDGKYYYHKRSEEVDYISGDESLTDCITDMNKTVKKISTEKVYECTNIDLMTYSGETNYIINSGAISPKSLLKVRNNISNVVKILQEKVSLLENMFISGLKSVLSGDMYSLATILYPEDFEQNDNTEQDIMVIPE